jgi:hypothetical protein
MTQYHYLYNGFLGILQQFFDLLFQFLYLENHQKSMCIIYLLIHLTLCCLHNPLDFEHEY